MTQVACHHHDSVELICLFRLDVSVRLKGGEVIEGKATDVQIQDKEEFLLLEHRQQILKVELTTIKDITAVCNNPYFYYVDFGA